MFCSNCGSRLPEGARFCSVCGARVAEIFEVPDVDSKPAASDAALASDPKTDKPYEAPLKKRVTFDWSNVIDEPQKKVIADIKSPWSTTGSIDGEALYSEMAPSTQRSRTMSFIDVLKAEKEQREQGETAASAEAYVEETAKTADRPIEYTEVLDPGYLEPAPAAEEPIPQLHFAPLYEDIDEPVVTPFDIPEQVEDETADEIQIEDAPIEEPVNLELELAAEEVVVEETADVAAEEAAIEEVAELPAEEVAIEVSEAFDEAGSPEEPASAAEVQIEAPAEEPAAEVQIEAPSEETVSEPEAYAEVLAGETSVATEEAATSAWGFAPKDHTIEIQIDQPEAEEPAAEVAAEDEPSKPARKSWFDLPDFLKPREGRKAFEEFNEPEPVPAPASVAADVEPADEEVFEEPVFEDIDEVAAEQETAEGEPAYIEDIESAAEIAAYDEEELSAEEYERRLEDELDSIISGGRGLAGNGIYDADPAENVISESELYTATEDEYLDIDMERSSEPVRVTEDIIEDDEDDEDEPVDEQELFADMNENAPKHPGMTIAPPADKETEIEALKRRLAELMGTSWEDEAPAADAGSAIEEAEVAEEPELVIEEPEAAEEIVVPELATEEAEDAAVPELIVDEAELIAEEPEAAEEQEIAEVAAEPEEVTEGSIEEPEEAYDEVDLSLYTDLEESDIAAEEPELVFAEPEVTAEEPELVFAEPEVTAEEPELVFAEPEVTAEEPELVFSEPEVAVEEPEIIFTEPEAVVEEAEPVIEELINAEEPVEEEAAEEIVVPELVAEEAEDAAVPELIVDEAELIAEEPEAAEEQEIAEVVAEEPAIALEEPAAEEDDTPKTIDDFLESILRAGAAETEQDNAPEESGLALDELEQTINELAAEASADEIEVPELAAVETTDFDEDIAAILEASVIEEPAAAETAAEEPVVALEETLAEELADDEPTIVLEEPAHAEQPAEAEAEAPAPKKETDALSIEELEQDLFGTVSASAGEVEATKKIDKFYTLYRKNEEFQRLLDEEYNKLKAAGGPAPEPAIPEPAAEEPVKIKKIEDATIYQDFDLEKEAARLKAEQEKASESASGNAGAAAVAAASAAAAAVVTAEAGKNNKPEVEYEEVDKGGGFLTVLAVIIAILLVILLGVILVLNFMPDSSLALKIDQIIENITTHFTAVDVMGRQFLL